ncbi:hypothetical protein KR044_009987 [Drosophila immigrans]|nr:hypothetical protein KR044_009987 [Drosophila immigrans]
MTSMGVDWGLRLLCCLLLGLLAAPSAHGQDAVPVPCDVSPSMALDLDQFAGIWWEIARQPVGSTYCTQINVTVLDQAEQNVLIDTTYSNALLYPWVNQTMNATLTVPNNTEEANGYNFTYWNPPDFTPYTVFKILDTDYSNYAFICGYTNATDNSTAFGMVIARNRTLSTVYLDSLESKSSAQYQNFANGSMSLITQDDTCIGNGAEPSTAFSVFYAVVAYVIYQLAK